jgi:hypothetical protein
MPLSLINLTLPAIFREIEDILAEYPEYPYRVAFSLPRLRQELVTRILARIPCRYTLVENSENISINPYHLYLPLEQRLRLDGIVRENVLHLLQEYLNWNFYQTTPKDWGILGKNSSVDRCWREACCSIE